MIPPPFKSKLLQKKYELTNEMKTVKDLLSDRVRTIYRIRALRDFGNVKADDLGGFIEHEGNLSHEGNCWVGGNAWIYNDAYISDNAQVCGQC